MRTRRPSSLECAPASEIEPRLSTPAAKNPGMRPTICVYGAGAISCHIAGHLAKAGAAEVSVVARGATASAIADNGICVLTPTDDFTVPVNVTTDPGTLGVQDYVIIALKIHRARFGRVTPAGLPRHPLTARRVNRRRYLARLTTWRG